MLPYFVLGMTLLAGLLLAARWFASVETHTLLRVGKQVAFGLVLGVFVFLAVTGRLGWAFVALSALLPWLIRFRSLSRTARNFSRMRSGAPEPGQNSEVRTRFLHMTLDHASGELTGEVVEGAFAGRHLTDLTLDQVIELLGACRAEDPQSVQILEAYLDRTQPEWRQRAASAQATGGAFGGGPMTRDEAWRILGLKQGAGPDEIKEAHRRLMAGLHPDHGGSTYLAAKLNQAKDVLLRSTSRGS